MPAPSSELIIERPDLQTRAQRYGYLSVTFVCWFLWLYLVVPLLSFAAWALGATLLYRVMLQNLDVAELLTMLRVYGTGIVLLTGAYLLWAVTSWLRFRRADRRSRPQAADDAALAASHHLSVTELVTLRDVRRTVIGAELLERMFSGGEAPRDAEPNAPEPPRVARGG